MFEIPPGSLISVQYSFWVTFLLVNLLTDMSPRRTFDLEHRLISFASVVIDISESLPKTEAGRYLGNQLVRSGIAPCLNYGEAVSAESRKDFIHKMKIALKELRETFVCLRLLNLKDYLKEEYQGILTECNELISIFVKSIQTARENLNRS